MHKILDKDIKEIELNDLTNTKLTQVESFISKLDFKRRDVDEPVRKISLNDYIKRRKSSAGLLDKYCADLDLTKPVYTFTKTEDRVSCTVEVGGRKFEATGGDEEEVKESAAGDAYRFFTLLE